MDQQTQPTPQSTSKSHWTQTYMGVLGALIILGGIIAYVVFKKSLLISSLDILAGIIILFKFIQARKRLK